MGGRDPAGGGDRKPKGRLRGQGGEASGLGRGTAGLYTQPRRRATNLRGGMAPSNHDRIDRKLSNGAPDGDDADMYPNALVGDYRWLRSVVESSSEIVSIVEPDGTLRYASLAFGRVL